MRVGHAYVERGGGNAVDATRADFAASLGDRELGDRDAALAHARRGWHPELHAVLRELLDPSRRILSVAAGRGLHEAVLASEGYRVVASDLVGEALDETARLFPELETREIDILRAHGEPEFDDALVAGLDYALDDDQLVMALLAVRSFLRSGGRVVLVHSYRDTLGARLVDGVLLPLWARSRRRRGIDLVRKPHGYRRSTRDVRRLAARAGLVTGRTRRAGHAAELTRVGLNLKAPGLYETLRRIDARLGQLNTATVLELLPG